MIILKLKLATNTEYGGPASLIVDLPELDVIKALFGTSFWARALLSCIRL